MPDEVTVEAKVKRECTHCGFEADLYESSAEYECPICRWGTMCRPAQDLTWYQDRGSSWSALQRGFYDDDTVTMGGYLFLGGGYALDER